MHTIIYKINNKDLLCSTGKYIIYLIKNYNGIKKEYIYGYIYPNLFFVHLKTVDLLTCL